MQREGTTGLHFPLISSTSGLLDENARQLISSACRARVFDIYASEEAGAVIAWECPVCSSYHINIDCIVLEIIRDGRPVHSREEGEVVITNLNYYTMPFIRYKLGDLAVLDDRSPRCGRGFPLLKSINGRKGDYIVLASGRKITPHPFFLALDSMVGVGEWKLTQVSLTQIDVDITTSGSTPGRLATEIDSRIRDIVGQEIEVKVRTVESIKRSPSEKLRSVVSKIGSFS
jgi:phenylacetate-CoA ligase